LSNGSLTLKEKEQMLDDHLLSIVSLVVGLVSLAASVAFFALGTRAERRNVDILEKINAAIQNWQGQIMASSIELLNSRVEIVGAKSHLEEAKTKHQFIHDLSERIKYIIEHPQSGEEAKAQSYNLQILLQSFESATKNSLTPEMFAATLSKPPLQPD
jgi:uncharacterized protein (DUF3084 family)